MASIGATFTGRRLLARCSERALVAEGGAGWLGPEFMRSGKRRNLRDCGMARCLSIGYVAKKDLIELAPVKTQRKRREEQVSALSGLTAEQRCARNSPHPRQPAGHGGHGQGPAAVAGGHQAAVACGAGASRARPRCLPWATRASVRPRPAAAFGPICFRVLPTFVRSVIYRGSNLLPE